jgi:hypothetical protein
MRWLVTACLLLGLAGCASPEPMASVAEPPRWVTPDPVALVEGTFRWHETGTGLNTALEYYDLASQAVAHPCVWEGGGGEEVYFNNLRLPVGRESQRLGAWSGNLSITLDWTESDWVGTALRVAYQAPGLSGWHETGAIERGSTLVLPIRPSEGNQAEEDEDAPADADAAEGWSLWLCFARDTGEPESPFLGSVQAKLVFAPDPILESEVPPAADEAGRTGRGGSVPTQPAL